MYKTYFVCVFQTWNFPKWVFASVCSFILQRIYGKWRNTESSSCENGSGEYDNRADFTQWEETGASAAPWVWQKREQEQRTIEFLLELMRDSSTDWTLLPFCLWLYRAAVRQGLNFSCKVVFKGKNGTLGFQCSRRGWGAVGRRDDRGLELQEQRTKSYWHLKHSRQGRGGKWKLVI